MWSVTRSRLIVASMLVVAVGAAAWLVLRPTPYADRDWSALAPVVPSIPSPWEPVADDLATLESADPCAVLRSIAPSAGRVERLEVGCRTTPSRADLEVWLDGSGPSGDPAEIARQGSERDIEGVTAWEVPATAAGPCTVFLPAGASQGLAVRSEDAEVCADLTERIARTLQDWREDPAAFSDDGARPVGGLPFTPYGEVTLRGSGACADLRGQWELQCAGHVDRTVPSDPVERIRAGEADPDVVCTAALEAAGRAGVDEKPNAVTAVEPIPQGSRACVLLVGDRDSVVWITASREAMGAAAGLEVAGHPARKNPYGAPAYEIALGDADANGHVSVQFDSLDGSLSEPEWGQRFLSELATVLLD